MIKRVIITGATSFLGKYIVNELVRRKIHVYAIIRPESKNKDMYENHPLVDTVLTNMDQVDIWMKKISKADAFLHLGWDGIGAKGRANVAIQEKNLKDAINCFSGAEKLGCKVFLFAGSQAEYGVQTDIINENTPCNPITEYGKFKLKVYENISELASKDTKYYHTRIFSVYGEGDHKWALVPSCIRTLCQNGEMSLSSCKQYWNYMYVTDAAFAICELLTSDAESGIYNIASNDTRILSEFIHSIHSLCNKRGSLRFGTHNAQERPANLQVDISKLTNAIGQIPYTPFEEAIEKMINLYEKTGELL